MISAVFLFLLFLVQTPARTGLIEGYVMLANVEPPSPLVNARLALTGASEEWVARTDSSGRFAFSGLPPGQFRLRVTKDGYIRQEYPHAAMDAPGLPIRLASGQEMRNVLFWLEPARTISGVIRDSDNAPIAGIVVQALRRGFDARGNRRLSLMASTKTDDRGSYRLYWLDPGEYFVSAIPSPPPPGPQRTKPFVPTYFPGFAAIDDAKGVRLGSDRDVVGTDFRLAAENVATVKGSIVSLTTGRPVASTVTLTAPGDGVGIARFQTRSVPDPPAPQVYNYDIPGVPPGAYILSAVEGDHRSASRIVVRGGDLVAHLYIGPGVTVSGRVAGIPGDADVRAARIHLAETDAALPFSGSASLSSDGTFTLPGVQPGYYTVAVSGLPDDLYLRTATFGGAEALEKPFAVAYGGPDSALLLLELGNDGGRISGRVLDTGDRLLPGVHVTLVPSVSRSRLDLFRTVVSAEDGSFVFRGIVPGDYKLFGWANPESNAYLNVEYMQDYEASGTPVRIVSGENPSVSLNAITIQR